MAFKVRFSQQNLTIKPYNAYSTVIYNHNDYVCQVIYLFLGKDELLTLKRGSDLKNFNKATNFFLSSFSHKNPFYMNQFDLMASL